MLESHLEKSKDHSCPPFVPRDLWNEFKIEDHIPAWMNPIVIQSDTSRAIRYGIWPIYIEVYTGPSIPDLAYSRTCGIQRTRIAMWRMYNADTPLPKQWYQHTHESEQVYAYAHIPTHAPYWQSWPRRTQEYRRAWQRAQDSGLYAAHIVTLDAFSHYYKKSSAYQKAGAGLLSDIRTRIRVDSTSPELVLVTNARSGEILCGGAFEYSPSSKSMYYITGFHLDSSESALCSIGLFDTMFSRAEAKNMRYVDFGVVWTRNAPRSWIGFSNFKKKFGVSYYYSSPIRIAIIPGSMVSYCLTIMMRIWKKIKITI